MLIRLLKKRENEIWIYSRFAIKRVVQCAQEMCKWDWFSKIVISANRMKIKNGNTSKIQRNCIMRKLLESNELNGLTVGGTGQASSFPSQCTVVMLVAQILHGNCYYICINSLRFPASTMHELFFKKGDCCQPVHTFHSTVKINIPHWVFWVCTCFWWLELSNNTAACHTSICTHYWCVPASHAVSFVLQSCFVL